MSNYLDTIGLELNQGDAAGQARHQVLTTLPWAPTATTNVSYSASNRVLIIAALTQGQGVETELGDQFLCYLAVPGETDALLPVANAWQIGDLALEGYLGRFKATLLGKDDPEVSNLGSLMGIASGFFDHVIDLGTEPRMDAAIKPPGYHFAGNSEARLAEVLAELPEMIGEFEKPRFFDYDPSICAHGRSGISGCTRCIDACPTNAIISIGEQIEVNPHLCQGGGVCASRCPSGAISYRYPPAEELIEFLRQIIRDLRKQRNNQGVSLLIYDAEHGADSLATASAGLPTHIIPVAVEEIGSVGPDLLASVLAYGASTVFIFVPDTVTAQVQASLRQDIALLTGVLQELAITDRQLSLVSDLSAVLTNVEQSLEISNAATFAGIGNKRAILRSALLHLHKVSGREDPVIALPEGSIFGQLKFAEDACTLCMGCVSVCPGSALEAGGETPALRFIEANCLQCGICTRACPESALTLEPRLNTGDSALRVQSLKEEEPFRCISCNKPFATLSMISRVTDKLTGHWMFEKPEQINRLRMCEDCRVADMFDRGDMIS